MGGKYDHGLVATLVRESGGDVLPVGAIAEGQMVRRTGGQLAGGAPVAAGSLAYQDAVWDGDGATVTFPLDPPVPAGFEAGVTVWRNGVALRRVEAEPQGLRQYVVTGESIVIGAPPMGGDDPDEIMARWAYIAPEEE